MEDKQIVQDAREELKENKVLKVVKIVVNVFFYILIIALFLFSIANINKKGDDSVPNLFGGGLTTVNSDSMKGSHKDSFTVKDLIFLEVVNDKNRQEKANEVEVGDIICFVYNDVALGKILDTHRVVDVIKDAEGNVTTFITQGDYVETDHPDQVYNKEHGPNIYQQTVQAKDLRGIYTGQIKGLGAAFKFVQTSTGFLVCIVLPVAIFFIVELIILILQVGKVKKETSDKEYEEKLAKMKEEQEALLEQQRKMMEEERARLRAEILAEQAAAQAKEEKKEE